MTLTKIKVIEKQEKENLYIFTICKKNYCMPETKLMLLENEEKLTTERKEVSFRWKQKHSLPLILLMSLSCANNFLIRIFWINYI
jgi:hypothetical protein